MGVYLTMKIGGCNHDPSLDTHNVRGIDVDPVLTTFNWRRLAGKTLGQLSSTGPNRSVGRLMKGSFALRHLFRPNAVNNFKSFGFSESIGSTS